jgi:hypothetical protein
VITLPRALSGGEIAGIVIGAIVGAVLLTLCIVGAGVARQAQPSARSGGGGGGGQRAGQKWTIDEESSSVPDHDRSDLSERADDVSGALQRSMSSALAVVIRKRQARSVHRRAIARAAP